MKTKVKRLVAIACLVFLVSIFLPYLQAVWRFSGDLENIVGPENLWSFRATAESWHLGGTGWERHFYECWFLDYWFPRFSYLEPIERLTGPVLILTLVSQISVLLFSTLAILLDKDQLLLCPLISNAVVLLGISLHAYTLHDNYETYPAVGFWLTLLAAVLFAVAFFTTSKDKSDKAFRTA